MRKIILILIVLFTMSFSANAFQPQEWMDYSTTKTADALIHTGPGYFYGFTCLTDGTNSVTFQFYDNTAGSGTRVLNDFICTTSATNRVCVFGTGLGIPFNTGFYVDITSSDATPDYTIFYRGK